MSVKCMARVWEKSRHKGSRLLLLLAIADFADDNGFAFPGLKTLAEKIRMSRSTAIRLVAKLAESKELYQASRGNVGRANRYIVTIDLTEQEFLESLRKAGKSGKEAREIVKRYQDATPPPPDDAEMERGGVIAVERGGVIAVEPDPSLSVTDPPLGAPAFPETPTLQDEASSLPASTEDPRLTRLRSRVGDNPLDLLAHCAATRHATGVPEDVASRPRGWQTEDISDAEFQVCQRVADLWAGGKMAGLPRFVDSQVEAAAEVLRLFDGDLSQALETITLYHEQYETDWQRTGRPPFSVVGPQSLVNVLRTFEAEAAYEAEAPPRAERFLF